MHLFGDEMLFLLVTICGHWAERCKRLCKCLGGGYRPAGWTSEFGGILLRSRLEYIFV